jgi:F0F1-type ATP synthase assembly protein I
VPEGLQRIFGGNWRQGSAALDVASALIGGILGLGMAGWLIDRWLGSGPAGLLVGLLLGGIVGFYRLGRVMLRRR